VRSFGAALATGGTVEDVEAWPDRIAAVTAQQVNAAAAYVFDLERSVTGRLRSAPVAAAALEPAAGATPVPEDREINAGGQDGNG
jgi:zinc protease